LHASFLTIHCRIIRGQGKRKKKSISTFNKEKRRVKEEEYNSKYEDKKKIHEVLYHCYSILCAISPVRKKSDARFQASAAAKMRSLLFLVVTQHILAIVYRRPVDHIFNGTYRLSRNVGRDLLTYAA
jgi:hypothetical protein